MVPCDDHTTTTPLLSCVARAIISMRSATRPRDALRRAAGALTMRMTTHATTPPDAKRKNALLVRYNSLRGPRSWRVCPVVVAHAISIRAAERVAVARVLCECSASTRRFIPLDLNRSIDPQTSTQRPPTAPTPIGL